MNDVNIFSFFCPTKIYMGIDSHQKVGEYLRERGFTKLLLLVDPAVLNTRIYISVFSQLKGQSIELHTFSDIEPNPSSNNVEKAFEIYRDSQPHAVLAIGGGSTIDVAKAVAILATNGARIHDYEGINMFSNPPLPLIAIPTTAGTGAEVSASCVITNSDNGLKMSIRHATLNPADLAILDPIALESLPATVAAHSSLDAFVHAFESFISLNASLITDGMNLYAMELIASNIRQFVANRKNLDAGLNMACASGLAGMTFGLTGLGNVHCMARFVGAFSHVSHGLSNAVCLPYIAEFNLPANPGKYARIATALGEDIHGLTEMAGALKALDGIGRLCKDLGIPERLRDIGVTEEMLPKMAELCVKANYNRWNPRLTMLEDFQAIFRKAY